MLPQGLLSRPDQASRLKGLALVLRAKFNAVGWPVMDAQLMPLVGGGAVQCPCSCSCAFTAPKAADTGRANVNSAHCSGDVLFCCTVLCCTRGT
jgi:hypothetical protein